MGVDRERRSLTQTLLERQLITEEQLSAAIDEQRTAGGRIGYLLVRKGFLSLIKFVSLLEEFPETWGLEQDAVARKKAASALGRNLAYYYRIAPIQLESATLTVGVAELENPQFLASLTEITGYKIDPMIFSERQIRHLLSETYASSENDSGIEFSSFEDNVFTVVDTARRVKALAPSQLKKDSGPAEILRSFITEAIKCKSREILIRPEPGNAFVSFRKESVGHSDHVLTTEMYDDLKYFLFGLAKMDSIGPPKMQNGKFRVKIHDRKILMVVSSVPGILGLRFRMEMFDERLLKSSYDQILKPLPELGQDLQDLFEQKKKGLYVITGPEGSGRTSFLYGLLTHYKEQYRQILTLENRIRYPLSGIVQRETSRSELETAFAEANELRPDLLAIHQLQDRKVAELAFLSAARIPVVAVMPSFDCFFAIEWMCAHRLKSAIKAGLLHSIVSFRLIPRICPSCSVPFEINRNSMPNLELPAGLHLKMNQGCDACRFRDHDNAEVFVERMRVDSELIEWLDENHSASFLRAKARTAGRKPFFETVMKDSFAEHLDMLSVMKLHATVV